MTSPLPSTSKRTTRLLARFVASGALALSLAGGLTAAASAAPAPADNGRLEVVPHPPAGEVVIVDPGPTLPTVPEPPDPGPRGPRPLTPCQDLPDDIHVPKECRPRPCEVKPQDDGKRSERPERCHTDPCKDKGVKDKEGKDPKEAKESEGDSPELRRQPDEKKCPPPPPEKKCDDRAGCDRPVPGKPNFTG